MAEQLDLARIRMLVIAGWTGRDAVARDHHIAELEALGVKRPAACPVYYRVAASRLTNAPTIEVSGGASSGEVEFALARLDGTLWAGLGSDHTDRALETSGIALSKQVCDKPVAPAWWRLAEAAPHWDRLRLRAWATSGGERVLYQEGSVDAMLPPDEVMAGIPGGTLPEGALMLCGTLPAIGGIRPAARFEMEIEDPILGRTIRHGYDVVELPVAG